VNFTQRNRESAFTLLEILITLSILVFIVMSVSQVIRNGFDAKDALSQKAKITHRYDVVMNALDRDLSGAFIVSSKDTTRDANHKRTLFKINKTSESDSIAFTYIGHSAIRENAKESDVSYVMYEVRESKTEPGRKHLYRGEAPRVPKDFKDPIPMELLAEDIAAVRFDAWQGDGYSKDKWDSTNSDTRDLMPHLVRVTVLAWEQPHEDRLGKDVKPNIQYTTVMYLPLALDFNELKSRSTDFALFK